MYGNITIDDVRNEYPGLCLLLITITPPGRQNEWSKRIFLKFSKGSKPWKLTFELSNNYTCELYYPFDVYDDEASTNLFSYTL